MCNTKVTLNIVDVSIVGSSSFLLKIIELRVHKLHCQSKLNKSGPPMYLMWEKEFIHKLIITPL